MRHVARLDHRPVHEEHARHDLLRPHVKADTVTRFERPRRVGQELERGVGEQGRQERAGRGDHVAALDGRALHALQIDGGTLPRLRTLDGPAVDLEAAHLGLDAARKDLDAVVHAEPSGHERPRHHGPEAFDGEDTIDRQPRRLVRGALGHARGEPGERLTELGQAFARPD